MKLPLYDLAAVAGFLVLLVGLLVLVGLGRAVPEYLTDAFWVFVGVVGRSGVGAANDYLHRNRAS